MIRAYFCEWNICGPCWLTKGGYQEEDSSHSNKGDYVEMKKRLHVGNKSNARECVKVMELCVFCFAFIFFRCLHFPLRMIIVHLCLMQNTIAFKLFYLLSLFFLLEFVLQNLVDFWKVVGVGWQEQFANNWWKTTTLMKQIDGTFGLRKHFLGIKRW